jgi:excisionase family DNA binding protein
MTKPPTEPIVVTPLAAGALLSIGQTKLYELIDAGELESYRAGRSRRITMASIKNYIKRQLDRDSA